MKNINNFDGQFRLQQMRKVNIQPEQKQEQQVQEEEKNIQEEKPAQEYQPKHEDIQLMQNYAAMQAQMFISNNKADNKETVTNEQKSAEQADVQNENTKEYANSERNTLADNDSYIAGHANPGANRRTTPANGSLTSILDRLKREKEERNARVKYHDSVNEADKARNEDIKKAEKTKNETIKQAENNYKQTLIKATEKGAEYEAEIIGLNNQINDYIAGKFEQELIGCNAAIKAKNEERNKLNNELSEETNEFVIIDEQRNSIQETVDNLTAEYEETKRQAHEEYLHDCEEFRAIKENYDSMKTTYDNWVRDYNEALVAVDTTGNAYDTANLAYQSAVDEFYEKGGTYDQYQQELGSYTDEKESHDAAVAKYESDLKTWNENVKQAEEAVQTAQKALLDQQMAEGRAIDSALKQLKTATDALTAKKAQNEKRADEIDDEIDSKQKEIERLKLTSSPTQDIPKFSQEGIQNFSWEDIERIYGEYVHKPEDLDKCIHIPTFTVDNDGNITCNYTVYTGSATDPYEKLEALEKWEQGYGGPFTIKHEVVFNYSETLNKIGTPNEDRIKQLEKEITELENELASLSTADEEKAVKEAESNVTKVREEEAKKTAEAQKAVETAKSNRKNLESQKPTEPDKFDKQPPVKPEEPQKPENLEDLRKAYEEAMAKLERLNSYMPPNPGTFDITEPIETIPEEPQALKDAKSALDDLQNKYDELSSYIEKLNGEIDELNKEIEELEKKKEGLENGTFEDEHVKDLRAKIKANEAYLAQLEGEKEQASKDYETACNNANTTFERAKDAANKTFESKKAKAEEILAQDLADIAARYDAQPGGTPVETVNFDDLPQADKDNIMSQLGSAINNSSQITSVTSHEDGTYTVTYYDKESGDEKSIVVEKKATDSENSSTQKTDNKTVSNNTGGALNKVNITQNLRGSKIPRRK